jgi:hypothetical protein
MTETASINRNRQGRIPNTLQAVFLASNRGKEVNLPPPDQSAAKVFKRNWIFQKKSNSGKNDKEGTKKNWFGLNSKRVEQTEKKDKAVRVVVTAPATEAPDTSEVSFLRSQLSPLLDF